jgi:tetratricopeptide (TPR) repeat protein
MSYQDLLEKIMSKCNGWGEVLEYIDNYIDENPDSHTGYLARAEINLEMDDYQEALGDIETAIELNPNFAEAYYSRGLLYAKTGGEPSKAFADFNKAIALNPNYADAYSNRGNMYLSLREFQKAINDCTKAIKLSTDGSPIPYFNRGIAYANMGEVEKAIEDYNHVIDVIPENAEAYAKRGALYIALGNKQRAIRDLETFLELDPDNEKASLIRDELNGLKRRW